MTPLLALADRVEQAEGPGHERDIAIAEACYYGRFGGVGYDPAMWVEKNGGHSGSIDLAMTLVPEGYSFRVGRTDDGRFYAEVAENDGHMMAGDPDEWYWEADAATGGQALTAAALRAQAAIAMEVGK